MTSLSEPPPGPIPDVTSAPIPSILQFSAAPDLHGHCDMFYFVAHGERVATPRTTLSLIAETTSRRAAAKVFASAPEAAAAWDLSGRPDGWEVVKL